MAAPSCLTYEQVFSGEFRFSCQNNPSVSRTHTFKSISVPFGSKELARKETFGNLVLPTAAFTGHHQPLSQQQLPCSCTKNMQIFEQLNPAIDTFSANLLKDGREAHRLQNTQEVGLQRTAQVLFRRVWKAHCLTGHDNPVLAKYVSQQAPLS